MYDNKGKEVCNNIIKNNFSKTATLKKLRLRDLAGKAKNLIIDKTVTRKEELGEINIEELEYKYQVFAIRRRNDFFYNSFTRSPMHALALGLVNVIEIILY